VTERILFVSTICSLSAGAVGPPKSFSCTLLTNHGVKSELGNDELDEMKKKVQAMQSGTAERKTSNREWRRPREFPEGALTTCTPSHPFSSTTPYIVQFE